MKYRLAEANIINARLLQKALFAIVKVAIQWHFENPTQDLDFPPIGNPSVGIWLMFWVTSVPSSLQFIKYISEGTYSDIFGGISIVQLN